MKFSFCITAVGIASKPELLQLLHDILPRDKGWNLDKFLEGGEFDIVHPDGSHKSSCRISIRKFNDNTGEIY